MNREQFAEWQSNPSTIEVFNQLRAAREALEQDLASGQTLSVRASETQRNTARLVGYIEGLNQLLNISYEDEYEQERPIP